MDWTLPNILTVARVIAAPLLAFVFVIIDRPLADQVALVLFIAAALTDWVDGWLARRLGQVSAFGKMLDPIADKAMVVIALAVLVGLSGLDPLILIPATLILLREVLVSGLREYLGEVKLPVTTLAKWKTAAQMGSIALLFYVAQDGGWLRSLGLVAFWLAAGLTVLTGVEYFRQGVALLKRRDP